MPECLGKREPRMEADVEFSKVGIGGAGGQGDDFDDVSVGVGDEGALAGFVGASGEGGGGAVVFFEAGREFSLIGEVEREGSDTDGIFDGAGGSGEGFGAVEEFDFGGADQVAGHFEIAGEHEG